MYTLLRFTRVFCALRWLNENAKKASRDTLKFDTTDQPWFQQEVRTYSLFQEIYLHLQEPGRLTFNRYK